MDPILMVSLSVAIFFILLLMKILFDSRGIKISFNALLQTLTKIEEDNQQNTQHARENLLTQMNLLKEQIQHNFTENRNRFEERQIEIFKLVVDSLHKIGLESRQELRTSLLDSTKEMGDKIKALTLTTENQLKDIHYQVEKRLSDGFIKTNETFNRVIERLALIDAAQKKITELSGNIISLQDVLNDKRSRGAFGEVQLSALIHNMIPETHFSLQHTLSNGKRADCLLKLPHPTNNIAIDAKFPLENFRIMTANETKDLERQQAEKQFKIDIRKHIQDIAEKYIIAGETADGAIMFIPSESIFAEIHSKYGELVEYAQQMKVWVVSPTTMMAVLTTARAVLKDAATRKQMHEIQTHLRYLANDFERFQLRMDNLAKRIAQANADAEQVHISSRKISQRFAHIERTEFEALKVEADTTSEEERKIPPPFVEPSLILGQAQSQEQIQEEKT